jgi:hypothetical protein
MTRIALFAAALALTVTASPAFAADSGATFDKTLTVSGAPTVTLATGSGYIHVNPGPDNQFHIVGHVHAQAGWLFTGSGDDTVKQIVANPPITQSGNTITVGSHPSNSDLYRNVSIDYDVTTPRTTAVSAHTGSGSLQIAGIQGAVSAGSGSGSVQLALANSPDVKAETGSGSITIEGVNGGLRAGTGSGSITIAGNPTADWHLSTGSGSIHLKLLNNARFTLSADTGSGTVHIDQPIMMQGSLSHHHVSGTVNGGGPTLRATTGSGDIIINGTSTIGQLDDNNALHVPGATDCVDNPGHPSCRTN